ncbi:MAG: lyase family protein, partial [Bacteroidota bacterium]
MLTAISPIDGRYADKTKELSKYFSEFALICYRVKVEVLYFKALCELPLPQLAEFPKGKLPRLLDLAERLDLEDANRIKAIERTTNHDVKAVEYFLKEAFDRLDLGKFKEFIHFGLTSQDVNNTATPWLLKDAVNEAYFPLFQKVRQKLHDLSQAWTHVPMLARTHGQPASPTLLGKEFRVFVERLDGQAAHVESQVWRAKFGGATGNLNAHFVAYPQVDWIVFANH